MEHRPIDLEREIAEARREFQEFRRDAYAYRNQSDDNLKNEIDAIRHEARVSTRWAIGLAVVVIVSLGGLLRDWAVSYEETERTLDKTVERVEWWGKHAETQDRTLESLNDRTRVLEQLDGKHR